MHRVVGRHVRGPSPSDPRRPAAGEVWHGGPVPAYDHFARFYDAAMDDPGPRAARVLELIHRHQPHASSLLELACGTGSILARLTEVPSLTGLDRSPEMLAIAAQKVPAARLIEADMVSLSLDERFDVVICVFDSLNHLLTFDDWRSVFRAAHDHLAEGGLFVFDVNTVGELRRLGNEPPWVYDFDDNVMIMDVDLAEGGLSRWDIQIFEHVGESQYLLHHEEIGELGVSLARIRAGVEPWFELLEEQDENGDLPTDQSVKAHFALRRLD
jgi:SAM-dependent methyltransferase